MALGDFLPRVGAKGRQAEDNEGLLEKIEVSLDGLSGHLKPSGEFVHGDFRSGLMGQHEKEAPQEIGCLDQAGLEYVFPQVVGAKLSQERNGIVAGYDLGITPVGHPAHQADP